MRLLARSADRGVDVRGVLLLLLLLLVPRRDSGVCIAEVGCGVGGGDAPSGSASKVPTILARRVAAEDGAAAGAAAGARLGVVVGDQNDGVLPSELGGDGLGRLELWRGLWLPGVPGGGRG